MRVVVVGGGIVGLAHAVVAVDRGHAVTLVERDLRPRGASVRNFGAFWPLAQPDDAAWAFAKRSGEWWSRLSVEADFAWDPCGALLVARTGPGADVLRELAAERRSHGLALLDARGASEACGALNPSGVLGALYSPHEARLEPREAIRQITAWLEERGVTVLNGDPVISVRHQVATTSSGLRLGFVRCVVASGAETRLLFPEVLAAAGMQTCTLQMVRTAPTGEPGGLGCLVASDLSLVRYAAFARLPSTRRLEALLAATRPDELRWGVHLLAADHLSGGLVLGDSHVYCDPPVMDYRSDIEEMILGEAARLFRVPAPAVKARWQGVYVGKEGAAAVVAEPDVGVRVVTGLGGGGMTLAFALAEALLEAGSLRATAATLPVAVHVV